MRQQNAQLTGDLCIMHEVWGIDDKMADNRCALIALFSFKKKKKKTAAKT